MWSIIVCRSGWNGLISIFRFFFDVLAALALGVPFRLAIPSPSLAFLFSPLMLNLSSLSSSDSNAIGASCVPWSLKREIFRGDDGCLADADEAPLRDRGAREAGRVANAAETDAAGARILTLRDLSFLVCGLSESE